MKLQHISNFLNWTCGILMSEDNIGQTKFYGAGPLANVGKVAVAVGKRLLLYPIGISASIGGTLREGDVCLLSLDKGTGLPKGLLVWLFFRRRLEGLCVGPHGPTRRIGSSGGDHCLTNLCSTPYPVPHSSHHSLAPRELTATGSETYFWVALCWVLLALGPGTVVTVLICSTVFNVGITC